MSRPFPGGLLDPSNPGMDQVPLAVASESLKTLPLPERIATYTVLSLLGRGGMGTIYLAYDTSLQRRIAIKVVHAAHQTRLAHEALLQARVEHPAVCRVYQVGEDQGQPYIAMQYIRGQNLIEATKNLSPTEKVYLMIPVVDGVHAAHRQGLIHRDLKPANIMVEQDEAGGLHPYVVDFGLARDWEESGQTQPGMAIGSPSYMAPEQVRGEDVDPRTDVYALGATLYELLTGQPPYRGKNASETLLQVLEAEPVPIGRLKPELPADLQSIVRKCLEKQSFHRYANAKALRDDLQRFLDGEPITARKPHLLERVRRMVLRHKLASALSLSTFLFMALLISLWIWSNRQRQIQMHWGQRFGQEIMLMESILRFGHMLALHDTTEERRYVHERMAQIREQIRTNGKAVAAPGHLALGQGYLLLNDAAQARRELEWAWNAGYRVPEVELALGRALTEVFLDARQTVDNIPNRAKRAEKLGELQRQLRDPALRHIQNAKRQLGQLSTREEARLAFVEERYDDAVALARQVYAAENWRYEALVDAAMGLTWSARAQIDLGKKNQAQQALSQALELLEVPLRIAPSDDRAFIVQRRTWALGYLAGLQGQSPEICLQKALEAQDKVVATNPEAPMQYVEMARLHFNLGRLDLLHQGNPEPHWGEVTRFANRVLKDPDPGVRAAAHEMLAHLAQDQTWRASTTGCENPEPYQQQTREHCEAAIQTGRASWVTYLSLGRSFLILGQSRLYSGRDADREARQAEEHLRKVVDMTPSAEIFQLLVDVLCLRSEIERVRGQSGKRLAEEALHLADQAIAMDRTSSATQRARGLALLSRGDALADEGGDPVPCFDEAKASFEESQRLGTDSGGWAELQLCATDLRLARCSIWASRNPEPYLQDCDQHLKNLSPRENPLKNPRTSNLVWQVSMLRSLGRARSSKAPGGASFYETECQVGRLPAGKTKDSLWAETQVARALEASVRENATPSLWRSSNAALDALETQWPRNKRHSAALRALLNQARSPERKEKWKLPHALWDNQVFQLFDSRLQMDTHAANSR